MTLTRLVCVALVVAIIVGAVVLFRRRRNNAAEAAQFVPVDATTAGTSYGETLYGTTGHPMPALQIDTRNVNELLNTGRTLVTTNVMVLEGASQEPGETRAIIQLWYGGDATTGGQPQAGLAFIDALDRQVDNTTGRSAGVHTYHLNLISLTPFDPSQPVG